MAQVVPPVQQTEAVQTAQSFQGGRPVARVDVVFNSRLRAVVARLADESGCL